MLASFLGCITVMIGAFGAHALKDVLLLNNKLDAFETGVKYQMIHVVVLMVIGIGWSKLASRWVYVASVLLVSGITLFSGSLYLLAITNYSKIGIVTPIGGVMLIFGWIAIFMSARYSHQN